MAFRNEDEEIECEIIESYGIFSSGLKFWNKEVNLISWNGMAPKLDIRNWQRDHKKCGKGIAITREEAEELVKLLEKILKTARSGAGRKTSAGKKSGAGRKTSAGKKSGVNNKSGAAKKQEKNEIPVPDNLGPFFGELKVYFGAGPEECKTARNTLLKKYHPDMYAGNKIFATRKTIKIKEAYDRIMDFWKANGLVR